MPVDDVYAVIRAFTLLLTPGSNGHIITNKYYYHNLERAQKGMQTSSDLTANATGVLSLQLNHNTSKSLTNRLQDAKTFSKPQMEASQEPYPARVPTLEVNDGSYPEVVPQTLDEYGSKDAAGIYHDTAPVAPSPRFWKRKWGWAIALVCVVIVGIIVGAVVGTHRPPPCTAWYEPAELTA
jgi:hypothetical protein